MKRICVITATRAEYGLLFPVLKEIENSPDLELQLIVSGTHLSQDFGYTKNEIVKDGFKITKEIEILMSANGSSSVSKSMGLALILFSDYIRDNRPDIAIILGDRYEMLGFAIALVNEKIPIAHINGGEVTEGALDDCYRHCITKLSSLHFTNCEQYKKRVIQMGEQPDSVYNVGDTCIDNITHLKLMTQKELEDFLRVDLANHRVALVTFHPVTTENDSIEQFKELLMSIIENEDYFYVFTKANADEGGREINSLIDEYVKKNDNCIVVDSLGRVRYLSLLNLSHLVIGNSSSGIYEAPYFGVPTINVGNRQKGRINGKTVINCAAKKDEILSAMNYAVSEEYKLSSACDKNFWGDGHASEKIVQQIKIYLDVNKNLIAKKFYDI